MEHINNKLIKINNKLWDELKGQVCDLDICKRIWKEAHKDILNKLRKDLDSTDSLNLDDWIEEKLKNERK